MNSSDGDSESATSRIVRPGERCCCSKLHIRTAALIVAAFSFLFVLSSLIMKAAGYSDTAWNWELLFLIIDSMAVVCLIYGIHSFSAAWLQPFVLLTLITISFLILLTLFFFTAVLDSHSYAGECLELEMRENVQSYATFLKVQPRTVIPLIALVITLGTSAALAVNIVFVRVIVTCARQFRSMENKACPDTFSYRSSQSKESNSYD